jgi:hypothetical protein
MRLAVAGLQGSDPEDASRPILARSRCGYPLVMIDASASSREEPDWETCLRRGFVRLLELLLRPPPESLAAGKGLLTRAEARATSDWLRPLEQMVRLLLAWSVMLMPGAPWTAPPAARSGPRPSAGGRRRGAAGFRLWCGASGSSGEASSDGARTLVSAWRLVARLEAVLAVVEDPAPCLARLARRWGRAYWGRARRPRPPAPKPGVSDLARPWLVAEAEKLIAQAALDTG